MQNNTLTRYEPRFAVSMSLPKLRMLTCTQTRLISAPNFRIGHLILPTALATDQALTAIGEILYRQPATKVTVKILRKVDMPFDKLEAPNFNQINCM